MFLPIDCLNSLANVSKCGDNRGALLSTSLLCCYSAVLSKWQHQRGCPLPEHLCVHANMPGDTQPVNQLMPLDQEGDGEGALANGAHAWQQGEDAETEAEDGAQYPESDVVEGDAEHESEGEWDAEEEADNEADGEQPGDGQNTVADSGHDVGEEAATAGAGQQVAAQGQPALPPADVRPWVARKVSREEVELVISAVGSLALARPCLEGAAQGGRGWNLAPEVVGHSSLLPLLEHVGAEAHWRAPSALAATRLGKQCGVGLLCAGCASRRAFA